MRLIDADALIKEAEFDSNLRLCIPVSRIIKAPTITPQNDPLTIEQLREMGGQPYWHVGLQEESLPPHWNILDKFYAKHIEDYKYGENWIAYRRPPERQGGDADHA